MNGEQGAREGFSAVPSGRWDRSMFFLDRVWDLFKGDRSLIAIAAIGTILNVAAAALIFGGAAWLFGGLDRRLITGIGGAVLAFPVTVVSTYCNVALLRMAQARFEGRHCTARQGFRAATRRLPAILGWSLLAVGVGALLDTIAERIPFAGPVLSWLGGVAWSLATMFAVPVLAIEDAGARRAAKRSVEIFRARWGEGLIGTFSIGFVSTLIVVPGVVILMAGLAVGGAAGVALAVVGGAILGAGATLSRGMDELFALALYRHQVQGLGAFDLAPEQLDSLVELKARKKR
jgi:hypothetical protein